MAIPGDYIERVYSGVLGKMIGVYLGRPFEGWTYDRIHQNLGEIQYYVHERLNLPLIVTDDDISGTFTFLRALPDYGSSLDITPQQIAQTWLNYIIEKRTILWWGGYGNSTEHTAYINLKEGIPAPESGSIARNSRVVAEQVGAQIFIDGWAMVCPGDPQRAVDLACRAASVSHDGEAIYGAQVLAAMEALAFVEADTNHLLDCGLSFIPQNSTIFRMIHDLREWHALDGDWRRTRQRIAEHYGYDKYGGNVHIVPNHALIILGLLYGEDDFQKSLMIVNTCGWDTDCNSGNLGCLLGIKNGLAGLESGPDWRGPVADRLYLPTAEPGRAISDAVTIAYEIANIGCALYGEAPLSPKNGAKFHFSLPGSVQGFVPKDDPDCRGVVQLENVNGHSRNGERSLAIHYHALAPGRFGRIARATFIPPEAKVMPGNYELIASPLLYPGQWVRASMIAEAANTRPVQCRLYISYYEERDQSVRCTSPEQWLAPGEDFVFEWCIPSTDYGPVAEIGIELISNQGASGTVYLDSLTWEGAPNVVLTRPRFESSMWRRAWANAVDHFDPRWPEPMRLVQDEGTGLLIQGTRDWKDYQVSADILPHLVRTFGLAARVQGLRRYYALELCEGEKVRLVKMLGEEQILAEKDFDWQAGKTYQFSLEARGNHLTAAIDGLILVEIDDPQSSLASGGIALVCGKGRMSTHAVTVRSIS